MEVKLSTKGLDDLLKAFGGKIPVARIGILHDEKRRNSDQDNADIGVKHEFGLDGMPMRSFLRVPLTDHIEEYLTKNNAFDKNVFKAVIRDKSIKQWVQIMAIQGEKVVADAFASGGFGKWKPSNMERKKVQLTLVETQQLRNSISSEVIE